jgi:hypothetical protein
LTRVSRGVPTPASGAGARASHQGSPDADAASGRTIWGVTTDDPNGKTAQQVEALRALPRRTTLRTVFDPPGGGHPTASDYAQSVSLLATVADIMGCVVDSAAMTRFSVAAIQARIAEYVEALNESVSIWEIGNEVNGNWLGSDVMAKVEVMYDSVKRAARPTALTLYYESPATPGHDMISWVDEHIPSGHRMRTGLDYVLVSYYEDQSGSHQLSQVEVDGIFAALADRFPNAQLGFGECGWGGTIPPSPSGDAARAALLERFYGLMVPSVPNYIGGVFYWHFRQTMVPKTSSDWSVLKALMTRSRSRGAVGQNSRN